ncbi:FMN-binding protein [Candidatus Magnetobacterium casense]|uniref:FMN-binding protein n=1 Tax=Candidatus Magnetobacterium casense TaxID=1455061 RepID=A0ABS6S2C6_9BACT|nr:FMN-binding protein [Candidatus Magnetobacterium casensis]MBV6342548.1 FMN-binding protein [Candidatus Magnetobacterium casensis]
MKRTILLLFALVFMSSALCAELYASQAKFFEHRYDYKLEDVLKADKFVQKNRYWEGYAGGRLIGYVFLSKDWTEKHVGYSGKHMETLIGMDTGGNITGVKLLFHSEPIVLIGLKEENYQDFLKQYTGKNAITGLTFGNEIKMDAITGATVTAAVQNIIISESAKKVATKQAGLTKHAQDGGRKFSSKFEPLTWKDLLDTGAVKNVLITSEALGLEGDAPYLDLHIGLVPPPSIGKNVLDERFYNEIMETLKPGESAVFIVARGTGSFKGSGFVRGGVFERFSIEQEARIYNFTDKDYRILTGLAAGGAPAIKEGGIFVIRGKDFDQSTPFNFKLMLPYRVGTKKKFKAVEVEYKVPDRFFRVDGEKSYN